MRPLKILMLALPLLLCLPGFEIHPHPGMINDKATLRGAGKGVLLVYTGGITGKMNMGIGLHIEFDSAIGIRYEVVYEQGTNVLAHTALFYKFSDSLESVLYDFKRHESTVNKCCGTSSGSGPDIVVIGQEMVNNFSCTHLQRIRNSGNYSEQDDYWMSMDLPGFLTLIKILNNISPQLVDMGINETIFNWGGLVEMKHNFTDTKGNTINSTLLLAEANSTMSFPSTDFDVPIK